MQDEEGYMMLNLQHKRDSSSSPSAAEGSGCKLCPRDWQLHRDKCYWVSREFKPWDRSHEDCTSRSSQLLLIQDQEELDFIKELTQASRYFWIGLSIPSPEEGWTWLSGCQFNQTL
ncbi:hypothetical protein Y1Q_0005126 [Alligator mississippiensis]|uniref:C-type lectin domain-containing protein n=1 Tax=Alligator mississippiensis TaxID=8496 RepID=A0A151MZK7_ALLMI|nr:hypothetical protein Y1Q_0005126 [Alligator mississippiensis]